MLPTNKTLGTLGIVRHEISFGEGRDVSAFGFTFLGGGATDGVPARYEIAIIEINGAATTVARCFPALMTSVFYQTRESKNYQSQQFRVPAAHFFGDTMIFREVRYLSSQSRNLPPFYR